MGVGGGQLAFGRRDHLIVLVLHCYGNLAQAALGLRVSAGVRVAVMLEINRHIGFKHSGGFKPAVFQIGGVGLRITAILKEITKAAGRRLAQRARRRNSQHGRVLKYQRIGRIHPADYAAAEILSQYDGFLCERDVCNVGFPGQGNLGGKHDV